MNFSLLTLISCGLSDAFTVHTDGAGCMAFFSSHARTFDGKRDICLSAQIVQKDFLFGPTQNQCLM